MEDTLTYWLLDTRSLWPGDRIDQAVRLLLCLLIRRRHADLTDRQPTSWI